MSGVNVPCAIAPSWVAFSPLTRREFREIRLLLNLTQADLAKRLGITRNTIVRWECALLPLPRIAGWAIKGLLAERRTAKIDRVRG